jgi:pimeloyl-ACP methyl ester carboxylesterase
MPRLLISLLMFFVIGCPAMSFGEMRNIPDKPKTEKLKVSFNGETLKAFYIVIDTRTTEEKTADDMGAKIPGGVFVFFQGHGQRPTDAYKFSSKISEAGKSGIVIVPVCDTPYGKDSQWRGDSGKQVVLMEIVRYVLNEKGICVEGYKPITDMPVSINGKNMQEIPSEGSAAKILAVGWSHGGILSRRFTNAYPDAVIGLAHVCPAGYEQWGSTKLLLNFGWECLRISTWCFRGHMGDVLGAAWGITKGIGGDTGRSVPLSIVHAQPSKLFRSGRDIKDCTLYCDDANFPVAGISNLTVIFAEGDSCIDVREHAGISDPANPSSQEVDAFWGKFYPSVVAEEIKLTFSVLPGSHLAPVSHSDVYAKTVLEGLDQLK